MTCQFKKNVKTGFLKSKKRKIRILEHWRRGQRTFRPDNNEDRRPTYLSLLVMIAFNCLNGLASAYLTDDSVGVQYYTYNYHPLLVDVVDNTYVLLIHGHWFSDEQKLYSAHRRLVTPGGEEWIRPTLITSNKGSLDPHKSAPQTASRSVQPFSQGSSYLCTACEMVVSD